MAQMRKTAQRPALGGNFWVLEPEDLVIIPLLGLGAGSYPFLIEG